MGQRKVEVVVTIRACACLGGSGVMIFDCSRFDVPMIGALPYITVEDLLLFLGADGSPETFAKRPNLAIINSAVGQVPTDELTAASTPIEPVPTIVEESPDVPDLAFISGPDDRVFSAEQEADFIRLYSKQQLPVKAVLRQMNGGQGISNRYARYASGLVEKRGLRKQA